MPPPFNLGQEQPLQPGGSSADPIGGGAGLSLSSSSDNPSIFECVARLAKRLRMQQPVYRVELEEGHYVNTPSALYQGHAEFSPGTKVPDGLGTVRGVLGAKEAKIEVAQRVLTWMQSEEQNREDMTENLLQSIGR